MTRLDKKIEKETWDVLKTKVVGNDSSIFHTLVAEPDVYKLKQALAIWYSVNAYYDRLKLIGSVNDELHVSAKTSQYFEMLYHKYQNITNVASTIRQQTSVVLAADTKPRISFHDTWLMWLYLDKGLCPKEYKTIANSVKDGFGD